MPDLDKPLLQAIADVIAAHPTWGICLIHGWLCGQAMAVSFSRLRCVCRQSGSAAQWRRRRKKIRRQQRVNPVAVHDVRCMESAEGRLVNGHRYMALLIKDEATAFGVALHVAPSFRLVDLEKFLTNYLPSMAVLYLHPTRQWRSVFLAYHSTRGTVQKHYACLRTTWQTVVELICPELRRHVSRESSQCRGVPFYQRIRC